jgi:hypothetical protein
MPDWDRYDPQLRQLQSEGVTPAEMARRTNLKPQTVRDRLIKLGLLTTQPKTKKSPPQEPTMPDVSATADIAPVSERLSPAEVQTLEHYEQIIAQGFKTFVQVGQALLAIRDQQLYRQSYGTFEDYLRQRWDLSRPYAYQLMEASVVVKNVSAVADIAPANEAQARPLATLPAEQQQQAWQEAVKTAPPTGITAKHVQSTVKRVQATTSPTPAPRDKPTPDRAKQAGEWRHRFSRHFRDLEGLLERFKQSGGVLVLVRDWEVPWQREFLQELRDHAKTVQDIVAHFEKVIIGEEAALRALEHPPE